MGQFQEVGLLLPQHESLGDDAHQAELRHVVRKALTGVLTSNILCALERRLPLASSRHWRYLEVNRVLPRDSLGDRTRRLLLVQHVEVARQRVIDRLEALWRVTRLKGRQVNLCLLFWLRRFVFEGSDLRICHQFDSLVERRADLRYDVSHAGWGVCVQDLVG